MGCVDEPTDLNERRNLLRGPTWDAVVAAVVAEAVMVAELEREAA
jgi:hypothetical protein